MKSQNSHRVLNNAKRDYELAELYKGGLANICGAGLAAALAKGEGKERVYIIEPTG